MIWPLQCPKNGNLAIVKVVLFTLFFSILWIMFNLAENFITQVCTFGNDVMLFWFNWQQIQHCNQACGRRKKNKFKYERVFILSIWSVFFIFSSTWSEQLSSFSFLPLLAFFTLMAWIIDIFPQKHLFLAESQLSPPDSQKSESITSSLEIKPKGWITSFLCKVWEQLFPTFTLGGKLTIWAHGTKSERPGFFAQLSFRTFGGWTISL